MRAARVTVVVPCVCVSVRSFLPPRASRARNIGTYVFIATRKKTFRIVIFAKNTSFRSYGVICLPPMPPTTHPKQWSRQRENFRNFSYNYVIAEVLVGALFGREDAPSLPVHGAGVEARIIALE